MKLEVDQKKLVKFKLEEGAMLPKKATDGSVGYDLHVYGNHVIRFGRNIIRTGVHVELPEGYEATVRPRSGFSVKGFSDENGLRHDADVILGTIDADYRGEIMVIVKSNETVEFFVEHGMRIAQLVISPVFEGVSTVSESLSDTERNDGGFNSTGV